MKLIGKIIAAILAGVITVLAVQQIIRRAYHRFGGRYFQLPPDDGADMEE